MMNKEQEIQYMMNQKQRALLKMQSLKVIDGRVLLYLFDNRGGKGVSPEVTKYTFGPAADSSLGRLQHDGHIGQKTWPSLDGSEPTSEVIELTSEGSQLAKELHYMSDATP